MMKKTLEKVDVTTVDDWQLCVIACHWAADAVLPDAQKNELYKRVYAQSDAYGPVGFIPSQGYDWSGVRDSTEESVVAMGKAAREYLISLGVTELEYYKESF